SLFSFMGAPTIGEIIRELHAVDPLDSFANEDVEAGLPWMESLLFLYRSSSVPSFPNQAGGENRVLSSTDSNSSSAMTSPESAPWCTSIASLIAVPFWHISGLFESPTFGCGPKKAELIARDLEFYFTTGKTALRLHSFKTFFACKPNPNFGSVKRGRKIALDNVTALKPFGFRVITH
ncbi:MAG: hypothetical protein ABI604_15105, partial [Nitrospirota bacterium]